MRLPISLRFNKVLLFLAVSIAAPLHADELTAPVDEALKQAAERNAPVLVDFYAPWCYSCYFMAKNVKTGPEWQRLEKKAVVVELDADSPEGAYWMQRLSVKGLPNYIVLDEKGSELGRIPLERTRAQFYPEIDAILARSGDFEALKAKVSDGSKASVTAAREVLQAFAARGDAGGGLDWVSMQPAVVSAALSKDTEASLWMSRLALRKALKDKDAAQCAVIAPKVLAADLGCDRAYELDRALECTDGLPADQRKKLFASQAAPMEVLLAKRVFIKTPSCADARSVVSATADLAEVLGDKKAQAAALDRAIADARQRLGGKDKLDQTLDLRRDRNLADNLRVYLDHAKRYDELDALFPKLIAAWPDDYVYAFRFGRSLVERGKYEQALPWLEQAAPKAYGLNRLNVAQFRAMALQKLGRVDDAKQVVADALKANGPFFPEMTAKLKAVVGNNG